MIATFGNSYRVEQSFTSSEYTLENSLRRVLTSFTAIKKRRQGERTRLYDSIKDTVGHFWSHGRREQPWVLIVITDGSDNESTGYPPHDPRSAANIGSYVGRQFMNEPDNFTFLLGVGRSENIDVRALSKIGAHGGFPAYTVDGFHLLELEFLRIACEVSVRLYGCDVSMGPLSWQEVTAMRDYSRIGIDYAFLVDRSGSMIEQAD